MSRACLQRPRSVFVVACVSVLATLALAGPVAAAASAPLANICASAAWNVVPNAAANEPGGATAVAVVSPSDVWAAGGANGNPSVQHWDGTQWSIVSTPPLAQGGLFQGVTAIQENDVWAVGVDISTGPLAEHWDGTQGSVIPTPGTGELYGVAGTRTNDVWAVGTAFDRELIEHWDGTQWSVVASPQAPNGVLMAIDVRSESDAWAVGIDATGPLVEHWNGSAWSLAPTPAGPALLKDVRAFSATDVWAVGSNGNGIEARAFHFDGTSWTTYTDPAPPGASVLDGLAGTAPHDLWAVGVQAAGGPGSASTQLIEHWDGTAWTVVANPAQAAIELVDVATSADGTDLWAVGSDGFHAVTEQLVCPIPSNEADLDVTVSGAATAAPGTRLTYTLAVTNHGPSTATNVIAALAVSKGFSPTRVSEGAIEISNITLWITPTVAAGQTRTFEVTGHISTGRGGIVTAIGASVSGTPDPITRNNVSLAFTRVT